MPQSTNEGLAAAINSALDGMGASETPTPETDEAGDESESAAGDENTDETAGEGDGEGESGEAGDESGEDDEAGEAGEGDGEDADGEGDADPEVDLSTGIPVVKGEPKPVVKDPVNDPIPNATKKETRERMQSLITTVKTLSTERDTYLAERDGIVSAIVETKSTPEQYGQALDYLKMVNSGDPAQQQQALTFMQAELVALSKILGVPVAGVDLLAGHPDLKQSVADGEITAKHAEELAAAREQSKIRISTANNTRQQQQTRDQTERERQAGYTALNALGQELLAKDGATFERKKIILVGVLQTAMQNAPPSKWAGIFKAAYTKLELPVAVKKRTVIPANQPLRGRTPAGGVQKEPGSLLEAVNNAIDRK